MGKTGLYLSPVSLIRRRKRKRLLSRSRPYFMDVACPGCRRLNTVFSHSQRVVLCSGCAMVLCRPTGTKAKLIQGCSYRRRE